MATRVNHLDTEIGKRLRSARLTNGLTQNDLSQYLGISFQQIQKYENGTNRIAAVRALQLAHALGLPVTYFYDDLDGNRLSERVPDPETGGHRRAISTAVLLNGIQNRPVKEAIYSLIKAISKTA